MQTNRHNMAARWRRGSQSHSLVIVLLSIANISRAIQNTPYYTRRRSAACASTFRCAGPTRSPDWRICPTAAFCGPSLGSTILARRPQCENHNVHYQLTPLANPCHSTLQPCPCVDPVETAADKLTALACRIAPSHRSAPVHPDSPVAGAAGAVRRADDDRSIRILRRSSSRAASHARPSSHDAPPASRPRRLGRHRHIPNLTPTDDS